MKIVYMIRGWLCRLFMHLEIPIKVVAKFAACFFIFREIAGWEGFSSGAVFNSTSVHLILALLCVLLPTRFVAFFAIAIIIYNVYQASFWGAILAAVMLIVLYIMIERLAPDETVLLILMPLAIKYNVFLLIPLFAGMYMGIFSIIPIVGGIILSGFMRILPAFMRFSVEKIDALPAAATETLSYVADQLIKNRSLLFMMVLCGGVVLVMVLLNRIGIDYMRYLSICAGALVGFVCLIVGRAAGMTDITVGQTITIPLICLLIMLVLKFFHMALNYRMAQRLAFADDEYYYYVRAIPKILGIKSKTEVKTITDGQVNVIPLVTETEREQYEERPKKKPAAAAAAPAARKKPAVKPAPAYEPEEYEGAEELVMPDQPAAEPKPGKNTKTEGKTEPENPKVNPVENLFQTIRLKLQGTDAEGEVLPTVRGEIVPDSPFYTSSRIEAEMELFEPEDLFDQAPEAKEEPEEGKMDRDELKRRTGWNTDTIQSFFEGLDKEDTHEGK